MEDAFEERQKSEEAKYKLDQEQRFKARSRRNKLLGLWAAERMGLAGPEAEAYAMEVGQAELQNPATAMSPASWPGISAAAAWPSGKRKSPPRWNASMPSPSNRSPGNIPKRWTRTTKRLSAAEGNHDPI